MEGDKSVMHRILGPGRLAALLALSTACASPEPPERAALIPARSPAPAREQAPELASVCPLLRDAPAPIQADITGGAGACPVTAAVQTAMPRSATIGEDELNALRGDIARAVAEHPRECVAELGRELVAATDCGIVYDAVAVRILTSPAVDPRLAAGELLRPAQCQWKLLSALRESTTVDPTIAATLLGLTTSADADVRKAAWMTLGTVGRLARESARPELFACIEEHIASELRSPTDALRPVLIAAAGNAGCERCGDQLHALLASDDGAQRRLGVTALRFLPGERDVAALCQVLLTAPESSLRGSAAFALRHGREQLERRLACLFEAATEDEAEVVSRDAVTSIAELASRSELGVGTLVQVVRFGAQESARGAAASALRAFATEEAIAELLNAPPAPAGGAGP
jgi:HEAT repeat protein